MKKLTAPPTKTTVKATPPAKRIATATPPAKRTTLRTLVAGSRVSFHSKTHAGKGVVVGIASKGTGDWYAVRTKDHPKGEVTVRRSQLS